MGETDDDAESFEPAIDLLQESAAEFTERDHGLHAMTLSGPIGFHAYYSSHPDDPLTGASTAALHAAFESVTEELWIDDETVEREHGEVTPETIATETRLQLEEFVGLSPYVSDRLEEEMLDFLRTEERQRDRLRTENEHRTLDEYRPRKGSVEFDTDDPERRDG